MFAPITRFVSRFNRNLWILSIGRFVGALGFAASIPFLSIYFNEQLHMSTTEIGLFFGGMAVVRASFQIVGGEISDRLGRSKLLVNTQLARSVAFIGIGYAIQADWGFFPVAILVTLNAIFGGMFFPAINALVSDILPESERLDGYAITRSAGNLGWAAGPALGGFMAHGSYPVLFYLSGAITFASGLIFWLFFRAPQQDGTKEAFRFSDLIAIRKDNRLAWHCLLIFLLYLVVAQLIAPFSVYTVGTVGITEAQLGVLFGVNGIMVAVLQIPTTRLLRKRSYTAQLAIGALLYFAGYGLLGFMGTYTSLFAIVIVVTSGEMIMSPPSLALTSRLAPANRMGRYMGVYGFFQSAGWSFGPLYGGVFLDHFAGQPELTWLLIASLAIVSATGYYLFGKRLPADINRSPAT